MKHLEVLGTYNDYQFVYYQANEKLSSEYQRMVNLVLSNTTGFGSYYGLDAGILLENDQEIIAGAFINLSASNKGLLILTIYVNEEHRRKGIHTAMHTFIDRIANECGKTGVFSNFHSSNKVMLDHVAKKQGYEPIAYVVRRDVKK